MRTVPLDGGAGAGTAVGADRGPDRLLGAWKVTGGAEGTVRYTMMEGGYFLLQHVELEQYGQPVVGLEVIRHLRPFGEDASEHVHSGFYDDGGNNLDYVATGMWRL